MSPLIRRAAAIGLVATCALSGGSSSAQAATSFQNCKISQIGLDAGVGHGLRLKIWCSNDTNVYYTNPGGTCGTTSPELVKLWESMAMSAFLSGKKLDFWFEWCGVPNIQNIDIHN